MSSAARDLHRAPGLAPGSDLPPRTEYDATATDTCIHCGLGLGNHHRVEDGPFCCHGCRTVYELIHSEGLEKYYDLRRCAIAPPPSLRPDNFAWLEPLLEAAPRWGDSSIARLRLDVQGVHCAACVWLLEKLYHRHPGGKQIRINPAIGTVDLLWDVEAGSLSDYLAEVETFGYRFGPARKRDGRASRNLLIRMGICISASMNVMMYSLSYYLGLAPQDGMVYTLFGRINFALAALAIVVGGWPFLRGAWQGVRRGMVHLDLPISLGMLLAFAGSTVTYLSQGPEAAYFDTIVIFVTLMLVGRWLQEHVLERNRNSLLASGGVADLFTRRFRGEKLEAVAANEIRRGETLWIAPGDLVPVEGVLLLSPASVSLDWITGEADPLGLEPGATVPAGAFNAGDRGFRLTANQDFAGSRLNELISSDESADAGFESGSGRWWHKVATIYVIAVLGLATLGFALWAPVDVHRAVEVAVAVLVVTCPCALGLALPLSRELVHVALRRRGVLLRRDTFLDRALQVRRVVFDKTGTLTRGQLRLGEESRRALRALPAERRAILAAMTARSSHPVSRCVAAALALEAVDAPNAPDVDADSVREVVGQGLLWQKEDVEYRFGQPAFVSGRADEGSPGSGAAGHAEFARNGEVILGLDFEEDLRSDAAHEVRRLAEMDYEVHLFSGDAPRKAQRVAEAVGIPAERAHGSLSPEAKAAAVRDLGGDALMVGDGLNDSLSFDAALCSATPAVDRAVLPQKADFYFLGDGIAAVRRSLQAARKLRRVQRDNLAFAVVYNLLAVALCLAGWVSPVVAAILMPLSSVAVVTATSTRLGRREARWMS